MTLKITKNKSDILRMCIVTRQIMPKKDMIRIVKNNKTNIYYIDDSYDSQPGRSAYVKKDYSILHKFISNKALHKTFKTQVPEYAYELIEKELQKYGK